jgi:LPXTG-motif cell wall-anchored protein
LNANLYLVIFLLAAVAGLGGLFVFGWKRRKDKMPKVDPLPRDDDWD